MANINIVVSGKEKGALRVLKSVGGALGGLAKMAPALLGLGGVAGIGAIGAGIAKLAIDAAPLEGIRNSFAGLTQDFEGGTDAMLRALQEGSAGMVTQRDLMSTFNEAAGLVSVDFAQKLPDAMGYLSKVSAATGQDMGFMLDSLVKGVGRLSPMILDNLQVQVSLSDATARAAEMFGVEADELTKAQIQAGMMDVTLAALAQNTAAMPDVTGSAAQTWGQFTTQLKDTKDQIGEALLPILTRVASHLSYWASQVLPTVVDWIVTKFVPALSNLYTWLDDNVIPVVIEVAKWLGKNLPPIIAKLSQWFNTTLLPALQRLHAFIRDPLTPIISKLYDWIATNLPPVIQKLADFWTGTLQPALAAVWRFLSVDMMPIWAALSNLIGKLFVANIKILVGIWTNLLIPGLKAIWGWIKDKIIPVFTGWVDSMGGIANIIKKIADKIRELGDFIQTLGQVIPDWLKPGSPTPFELGLRGIAEAARDLKRIAPPAFEASFTPAPRGPFRSGPELAPARIVNINLQANYAYQSPGRLVEDARLLEMIYGA